jgi:hypothetical protein
MKFNKKFDSLNRYLNELLNSVKFNEPISGNLDKLKQQKYDYDEFHCQLDSKKNEFEQFFNEYHTNNDYEIISKLKQCELNWKLLYTKSQEKKDKLMICYDLAEQFMNYYTDLDKWLNEIENKIENFEKLDNKTRDYIIEQLDNDEHFQKELKIKLNCLKDFIQIANELNLSVQTDKHYIDDKISSIDKRFNFIQTKNKQYIQALNERLQNLNEYNDILNDINRNLETKSRNK